MLKIRQEQLDVLAQGAENRFKLRLQGQLRLEYAREVAAMSDEQLKVFVDTGVNQAKAYQIVAKCDVADYLVILLSHGVGFEHRPEHRPALAILTDPETAGGMKLRQLKNLFEHNRGTYA